MNHSLCEGVTIKSILQELELLEYEEDEIQNGLKEIGILRFVDQHRITKRVINENHPQDTVNMATETTTKRTTGPVGLNDIDFEHTSFIDVQFESSKIVLPESGNMIQWNISWPNTPLKINLEVLFLIILC